MTRQSKPNHLVVPRDDRVPGHGSRRRRLAACAIGAAAMLAFLPAASAQSQFGQSCMRSDAAAMPLEEADASYEGTSAQQLMNGIAKEMARQPARVGGAYVFKAQDRVLVLWIRGQFLCNSGPFERTLFDRVVRNVFGVEL
jgi:hypothetical protein